MNNTVEAILQEIGNELLEFLGDDVVDVLVYSEVIDGLSGVDLIYRNPHTNMLVYKYAPDKIFDLFYDLWDAWPAEPEKWRAAEYVLQGRKLDLKLIYPDGFDEDRLSSDRRASSIKKYFGNEEVDYEHPE